MLLMEVEPAERCEHTHVLPQDLGVVSSAEFYKLLDESGGRIAEPAVQFARAAVRRRSGDLFFVRLVYIEIMSLLAIYLNNAGITIDKCYVLLKDIGSTLAEIDSANKMLESVFRESALMEGLTNAAPTNNEIVINSIKRFIQENYMSVISLEKVAEIVHLHPNYVSSLYKRNTGVTFVQYVNQVRIDKAKEMILMDPGLAMETAGVMTGYENPSHFFKVFKRLTGMTPKQFREKNRISH